MAEFERAYAATNVHEGEVSDHPSDPGGLTFRGIASTMLPGAAWEGWRFFDRNTHSFSVTDSVVEQMHRSFFRQFFWRALGEADSQPLANEIYDAAVLCGPGRAGRWLQRALNGLNRGGDAWRDLSVDGLIGPMTLIALNRASADLSVERRVLFLLEAQRATHHLERALEDESMEAFLNGHIERVLDEDFR